MKTYKVKGVPITVWAPEEEAPENARDALLDDVIVCRVEFVRDEFHSAQHGLDRLDGDRMFTAACRYTKARVKGWHNGTMILQQAVD